MAKRSERDLAAELAKPSFTPGQRDVPALVELIVSGEEPAATRAAPALAKLGAAARDAVLARVTHSGDAAAQVGAVADDGGRARLVSVLGLMARAGDEIAAEGVLARMQDGAVRVRRAAASALGKLGGEAARAALIARWDADDVSADERRVLAEALGKVGGDEARARLAAATTTDDAELARRRDRALLMAERTARRDEVSAVRADVAPPVAVTLRLGCRAGLAGLLVEELRAIGMRGTALRDDAVDLALAGPLSALFASRLWASVAVHVPLDLGADADDALATAIVHALTAPAVRALLRAWTAGPIRWRIGFAKGHRRSVVWRVARDVTAAAPELVNDPTATTWDVLVDTELRTLDISPRRLEDPRFAWRVAEVPAASHPTVAAALAWVAEARGGDRVWDPFCGAGAELVERARRGPYRALHGSDIDEAALAAARANADAAGVPAELARGDARSYAPGPVDLVITNPPLGSRVHVDAIALLTEALPNLVRQLAPGGRLVWILPAQRRGRDALAQAAERLGLRRTRSLPVDLGGVRGNLERWDR